MRPARPRKASGCYPRSTVQPPETSTVGPRHPSVPRKKKASTTQGHSRGIASVAIGKKPPPSPRRRRRGPQPRLRSLRPRAPRRCRGLPPPPSSPAPPFTEVDSPQPWPYNAAPIARLRPLAVAAPPVLASGYVNSPPLRLHSGTPAPHRPLCLSSEGVEDSNIEADWDSSNMACLLLTQKWIQIKIIGLSYRNGHPIFCRTASMQSQCCRDPHLVADVFLQVIRDLRVAAQNY